MSSSDPVHVNCVTLRGRLSADPEERVLPSGDRIVTFRIVVPRTSAARRRSRQACDVIECVAWTSRLRAKAARFRSDDTIEVTGALRRRFTRTAGSLASYVSVELTGCTAWQKVRR
ncbi:single-stranded DNA-binding protein [Aeromicrobium sp. CTD01-1L150]|uniref:single-stranded DNA-binding protein n=1 Tax=Aeromicrobium sp. CTD01-1L150 TaxID=3341830 RepID=UPI0035C00A80